MDKSHHGVVIWFVLSSMTTVSANSTIFWTEYNDTLNCIGSVTGDPDQQITQLQNDSNYHLNPNYYCTERYGAPIGPLAWNPTSPNEIISTNQEGELLEMWKLTDNGWIATYFQGTVNVTSIAIDYQSQNIYFTVPTRIVIMQYGMSPPYYNILVDNRHNPREILIDSDAGVMFWAEYPSVIRADLTGSIVEDTKMHASEDVQMALSGNKIYVMQDDRVDVYTYTGIKVNCFELPETVLAITVFQKYVYGTAANYPNILVFEYADGKPVFNFSINSDFTLGDIIRVPTDAQERTGVCATNNGGCSHICIHNTSQTRICKCGFGFTLQADDSSCKSEYLTDNFVLVTDALMNTIYQINITSGEVHAIPVEYTDNQFIESVVYDPVVKQVIWMDTGNNTLRSLALAEDSTEKIIYTFDSDSFINGIAFDHINRVVYYTDYDKFEIGRVYLNGTKDLLLSTASEGKPVQIVLDVLGGYVYWSTTGQPSRILRAQVSGGSGIETIVETGLIYPSGLALNIPDSILYWLDSSANKLEKVNVDGTERSLLTVTEEGYTLALDNDYLYVVNFNDITRYALPDMHQSAFTTDIFSLLDVISLYSTSVSIQPGSTTTTTTTTTTSTPDIRSGAPVITGLTWPIWGLIWLRYFLE